MTRTADVLQGIWADPWFLAVSPSAKVLYLWGITTTHGNLAGLFVAGDRIIQAETGLDERAFASALQELKGKIHYRQDTGTMWVVGKAKHVRMKTPQVAKSVAKAVKLCPSPDIQQAFLARYGKQAWLRRALIDLGLDTDTEIAFPLPEPKPATELTDDEQQLVDSLLRAFNVEANGIYSASKWSDRIVACLRAHPDLTEKDHLRVVRNVFRKPWWTGAPTPGVIWGNLAQFEKCVAEARKHAASPVTVSYDDATEVLAQ